MMRSSGDRATFAVEVGDAEPYALRTVDVWAAGKRLTVNDNRAFVPVFTRALRSSAVQVRQRDVARCPFPDRTPEEIFRTLRADDLVIVFAFWRDDHPSPEDLGKVFVTRIPADEFAATAEEAADLLHTESIG